MSIETFYIKPAPHKIVVLGQRLPAGTVAAGVPTMVFSGSQGEQYYGRGSMLATMISALKSANNYTETWAIALDDAAAGASANLVLGSATALVQGM